MSYVCFFTKLGKIYAEELFLILAYDDFQRPRKARFGLTLRNADIKPGARSPMRSNTLFGVQKEDWVPRSFSAEYSIPTILVNR